MSQWRVRSHLILYQPADAAVFLLPADDGWQLPRLDLAERVWVRPKTTLNQQAQAQWGLQAISLNCAALRIDRDKHEEESVFVLEVRPPVHPPASGRFFSRAAMPGLDQPQHQALLQAFFDEVDKGSEGWLRRRPPWLQPGWFDQASAWMAAELARLGYSATGPAEQLSNWPLSCILRAPTTAGDIYLKAVADLPLFVNEPVLLNALAPLCPGHVPQPLAIDPARRWMLLPDFGNPIGDGAPEATLAEMVRQCGRLQAQMAGHVPHLLEIGCLDRRLQRLARQIDDLLADEAALAGLEAAETDLLRRWRGRLKGLCAQLAGYNVPQTLMHGDLHLENVAWQDGRMLFFDWTDACIAHPFLDMMVIYEAPDEASQVHLRDQYLQQWTAFEPMERLLEAWELAGPLWRLHQAVSYQHIIAGLEPLGRYAFGNVIPTYLREVLRGLGDED